MKELKIDCVDDGVNGFMRTFVDDEIIQADDPYNFFDTLLTALGYDVIYNNIEEEV